uniref:PCI domain-containing protein n=1 Tax=Eucampia antarctica TaxID=49252 RepID=A0A7S2WPD9_9STRA|mmetsp:Transcript_8192/g.7729  ORF Transcript_8192/g.7729 Transcript_8192/m.7729 type:complete len:520 (+) Transcript_8192:190-1749(+)|eukprot:CAMPEP_0197834926 /NCGR_PEP_ID=MMETSP1437-20131217/24136_1 /TAXON_ID=49252 ORGANISM="Eucampia antarctica, Strain CCMP1452" /NCGR_SAMPLE_ID=MMETSP1437 /ASSEMBLY_ACC=CAM_ASM_001096 /LENGTH=519 /DNA_ID=CAMNT_0043439981 /DNA_START=183 /DNA_END=1742 /DNA_ORIENTATION=+
MSDSKDKTVKDESVETPKISDATPTSSLEACARRLERSLGGGEATASSSAVESAIMQHHVNPSKTVRRWLGTSSGASGSCTLEDVARAASSLLDPMCSSSTGRDLLMQLSENVTMEDSSADNAFLTVRTSREVESWLLSLAVRILFQQNSNQQALILCDKSIQIVQTHLDEASAATVGGTASSLYPLLARLYRYQSLVVERIELPDSVQRRAHLMDAHRMACLRRDVDTSATLLNLLLRDLLRADQVEQAHKLLSNSTFPDAASNNQFCRFLYHSGRIQALRLEYTSAFSNLSQCLRKAPSNTGLGFRIAAQRLLVVVQLLMGEVPERNVFFTHKMVGELKPYRMITQAVRRGDLAVFHKTVSQFADRFKADGTYTLISRLAHSVVKAGLRKLNMSYSRISLQDIADRLGLQCATSAEFVVAKAIRDGVIDATVNHEGGFVQSHDLVDVYATTEPSEAFHRRIAYCLTTHNDAVRAMRYPPDAYKKQLEASRGLRGGKNDDKTDEEKAQELEDELDEDY